MKRLTNTTEGASWQELVAAFHERYQHHRPPRPETDPPGDPSRRQLRLALIREETAELEQALLARDLVATADALADLAYVVVGTAVAYGIPLDACFREVHRSNMTKALPPAKNLADKYPPGWDPKGPGYSPPDLETILQEARRCHPDGPGVTF